MGALGGASPTPRPDGGQDIGQADSGAIQHPHPTGKALPQRQRRTRCRGHRPHRGGQHPLQQRRGLGTEALGQALRGDGGPAHRQDLRQLMQCGLRLPQPTQHHRLHEARTRQDPAASSYQAQSGGGWGAAGGTFHRRLVVYRAGVVAVSSGLSPASIAARWGSRKGGSASRSPRCSLSSSVAKPGPSVAISKRTRPGSRK